MNHIARPRGQLWRHIAGRYGFPWKPLTIFASYRQNMHFYTIRISISSRWKVLKRVLTHWGRHKMAATFQTTFSNGFSSKFVPRGPINNILTFVQVMAWRRPGDKPLSEPLMVRLPRHICVTRPQWVNWFCSGHILNGATLLFLNTLHPYHEQ